MCQGSGLPKLIPLLKCVLWPTITLHLHFLKQFHAGVWGRRHCFWAMKIQLSTRTLFAGGKKSLFGNTSELLLSRNSLDLLRLLKWNNTSGQNCYEYSIFLRFSYYQINHQKAKVYKTLADSTLFYCSPLFGIHYNPFSQNISLYLALFSITNKCTWYWYIIIHIAITHEQ